MVALAAERRISHVEDEVQRLRHLVAHLKVSVQKLKVEVQYLRRAVCIEVNSPKPF